MRAQGSMAAVVVLMGCAPMVSAVSTDRGIWFFDVVGHRLASGTVVGNAFKEDNVISKLVTEGVSRVYSSFANPVPPPADADIAAWNAKLNANGITPMLLLSDASELASQSFFDNQLINFNNGRPANEQYAGVKLDLEPQAAPDWATDTPAQRRDTLLKLRDTYADIRAHLDANGEAGTPIYADLPVWFDVTGGTIGWGEGTVLTAEQERDQWFTDIASSLDGITLMAFGTSFFASIESNVNWEINNFGADVRVALEALVGDGQTWPYVSDFFDMADQIEAHYSIPANNPSNHSIGIDIQNLTNFFDAVAPEPTTAVLSLVGLMTLSVKLRRFLNTG